jgi:hypothetical protein
LPNSDEPALEHPPEAGAAVPGDAMTAAGLFALLWESLADLLGTAATATLLHRSARRAAVRHPELNGLVIKQQGFVCDYRLPEAWHQGLDEQVVAALRELVQELVPVLVELTGPVVVRRLAGVAPLQRLGIVFPEKRST